MIIILKRTLLISWLIFLNQTKCHAGFLEIRDGYFFDTEESEYFVPRGIAYQTWNPPVFATQSFEQITYDLEEFKRMGANSVRVDFVWSQLELADNKYDFSKARYLVNEAKRLGLRLFPIIGYQYPPSWFNESWYAINDQKTRSDVLNYEHPVAQQKFVEHVREVAKEFKDEPTIAAWILGNEFAYFDLWEDPGKFLNRRKLGYDLFSLESFRSFLAERFNNNIGEFNSAWGTQINQFNEVSMPQMYPDDREEPGYHDLIQWRKASIGKFIARGAEAVQSVAPNHLLTYSMVGGIFNGNDANNTAEDGVAIVNQCKLMNAPLDFWSINNYAWATEGSELRSGDYGITKYQNQLGLPVVLSETGHSSTEDLLPGASIRQSAALPGQIWESLVSGAIGTHIFHWSDRNGFTEEFFIRERGFGIVSQVRIPKQPVYGNVERMFRQMSEFKIDNLLGGSRGPIEDIHFFWSEESDMGWPTANQENAMIWGALKRNGFQPRLIDDSIFEDSSYSPPDALILSRAFRLKPSVLQVIEKRIGSDGWNVFANVDLPGRTDRYGRNNVGWSDFIDRVFGADVVQAQSIWDSGVAGGFSDTYRTISVQGAKSLFPINNQWKKTVQTWKITNGIRPTSGEVIATHRGVNNSSSEQPALIINKLGAGETALTTFGTGDVFAVDGGVSATEVWDFRSDLTKAIFNGHFGMKPKIQLSGDGSQYIIPDYRILRDGGMLVFLLNGHHQPVRASVDAPEIFKGNIVENLTNGEITSTGEESELDFQFDGDGYKLLYVYKRKLLQDSSLINPAKEKIWIQSAPNSIGAGFPASDIRIRYDLDGLLESNISISLESTVMREYSLSHSESVTVTGKGETTLSLAAPDFNAKDIYLRSSNEGEQYVLRVVATRDGKIKTETTMPVLLSWPIRPYNLPVTTSPGQVHEIHLSWEDLPSYLSYEIGTPLDRALLWESDYATREYYNVILELVDESNSEVAKDVFVAGPEDNGHAFSITTPSSWIVGTKPEFRAYLQPAPGASRDIIDSFEGRTTGATVPWPPNGKPNVEGLLKPWEIITFSELGGQVFQNSGIHSFASHGSQSAFLVMIREKFMGDWAGFGMVRDLGKSISLPVNRAKWSNYRISFDFHESSALDCELEIQIKNRRPEGDPEIPALAFRKRFTPDSRGWDHVSATLDEFKTLPHFVDFDPRQLDQIILVVSMIDTGKQYVASIDNFRFDGPEKFIVLPDKIGEFTTNNDFDPDSDKDGVHDSIELITGTNPLDSESVLKIVFAEFDKQTEKLLINFPGVPGPEYQILKSIGGLNDEDFLVIRSGLRYSDPGKKSVAIDIDPLSTSGYFRIRAMLPNQ